MPFMSAFFMKWAVELFFYHYALYAGHRWKKNLRLPIHIQLMGRVMKNGV